MAISDMLLSSCSKYDRTSFVVKSCLDCRVLLGASERKRKTVSEFRVRKRGTETEGRYQSLQCCNCCCNCPDKARQTEASLSPRLDGQAGEEGSSCVAPDDELVLFPSIFRAPLKVCALIFDRMAAVSMSRISVSSQSPQHMTHSSRILRESQVTYGDFQKMTFHFYIRGHTSSFKALVGGLLLFC